MQPPGAVGAGASSSSDAADPIRGHHDAVPGAVASRVVDAKRRREEAALAARQSHIAQSLADHAERVAKKARSGGAAPPPSPASRLAAVRERLAARVAAACAVGDVAGAIATADSARVSRDAVDSVASTAIGAAAAGRGGNSVVGISADQLHAAMYAAQHGVARAAVGEPRRLSG